jgi:hypothetical protein
VTKSRTTKEPLDFRESYASLKSPPPAAPADWYRTRGRQLEGVLNALLEEEGLEPRLHYRSRGEEIDGSFVSHGRVFLLEAKWHGTPVAASALYAFKGKVDGKLVGTLGVFISMSDYSRDAVDALTVGKDMNVLLFDKRDLDACMDKNVGFKTVLGHKLRLASEIGLVYAPYKVMVVSTSRVADAKIGDESAKI